MKRTTASPATTKQVDYINGLMRDRVVPDRLREQVLATVPLTDGDCRTLIPLLENCDEKENQFPYDEQGNYDYEDWRDHPDAVFGDPNAHGSH